MHANDIIQLDFHLRALSHLGPEVTVWDRDGRVGAGVLESLEGSTLVVVNRYTSARQTFDLDSARTAVVVCKGEKTRSFGMPPDDDETVIP